MLIAQFPGLREFRWVAAIVALLILLASTPVRSFALYNFTTIVDSSSGVNPEFTSLGERKLNDSGEVAFLAEPSYYSHRIYKGSGGALTQIASGSFWGLNTPGNGAIANSGDVVFGGGEQAFNNGIYLGDGGTPVPLIIGNQNPSTDGTKRSFFNITTSNSGRVAYRGDTRVCQNANCGPTVSGYYTLVNQSIVPLAEQDATWGGPVQYSPAINDSGQAVFAMYAASDNAVHLLFHNGASLETVKTGFGGGKGYSLNNAGQVVYGEVDAVRLFDGGVTTTIASTAHGFDALMKTGTAEAFINDSGQVAFWASVAEYQGNPVNWEGVYTGPSITNDRVLVYGDTVLGHVVGSVELLGLNNAGQLLMGVAAQSPDTWRALLVATKAPLPGDENGDSVVDAADYVLLRNSGAPQAAFDTWRANFGATAGSAAELSSVPIPEPAATGLAVVAACLAVLRRRVRLELGNDSR